MAEKKLTRQQIAANDIEALLLDPKFLRFLSTVRVAAGIETTAYGPADRHLYFMEGRRSLWCNILCTAEIAQPDALLHILMAENEAAKETTSGRRKYDRLRTDDGDPGDRTARDTPLAGYLDYSVDG